MVSVYHRSYYFRSSRLENKWFLLLVEQYNFNMMYYSLWCWLTGTSQRAAGSGERGATRDWNRCLLWAALIGAKTFGKNLGKVPIQWLLMSLFLVVTWSSSSQLIHGMKVGSFVASLGVLFDYGKHNFIRRWTGITWPNHYMPLSNLKKQCQLCDTFIYPMRERYIYIYAYTHINIHIHILHTYTYIYISYTHYVYI